MKNIRIHILILFLCLLVSNVISAQAITSEADKMEASDHIRNLKKGVLIVQISTQNKKIEQLEKMIRSNPDNQRLKSRLTETVKNAEDLLAATVRAYSAHFDFAKVVFMPDTMVKRLYAGERTGLFLDNFGKFDSAIQLDTENFYITYVGLPQNSDTGKKSLVIIDNKGNRIGSPFPYAISLYNLGQVILNASDAASIESSVIKQNKKLKAFLQKINQKELETKA